MAHRTNLTSQASSNLPMVSKLENLFQSLYVYFSSSLKCHLEFIKPMKSWKKRLKILKNVKIQWISMLEPLKHVLAKYIDVDCEDVIRQH